MRIRGAGIRAAAGIAALISLAAIVRADWPQWRGPKRDGHATTFDAPAKWPERLEKKWQVRVGIGHASPLIAADSVFAFSREGEEEVVRRISLATGKDVWRKSYPAPYEMNPAARGHGKGPKSTPLLYQGRLYTFGISGILSCFQATDGKLLWRNEYAKQFSHSSPDFGTALSPAADGGLLYVHAGGKDQGAILALAARSGETKWEWKGDGPSYAAPMVFTVGGVKQLVTQTQKMIVGLDAASGKLLWSLPFTTPYEQNIVTPIQFGDLLIFGGLSQAAFAVKLERDGDKWKPGRVWETREASFYMSTPVLKDGKLYGMSSRSRGQLITIDAATGKVLWTDENRTTDNASLVSAGTYVLVLPVDAELRIMRPNGGKLETMAKYPVATSATWATPAYDRTHIVVKDLDSLTRWDVPGPTP